MAGRRAAIGAAIGVAALLGAAIAWRAVLDREGGAAAPAAPQHRPTAPPAGAEEPRRREATDRRSIAAPPPAPQVPEPPPALSASGSEPMIDIPAGPPPDEGAGDDLEESGLPPALFEAKVALERIAPQPVRLDAAEARLGRAIPPEVRDALAASFRKHDEAAAIAIGDLRLRAISPEDATALVARERDAYRREAAAALGVPADRLERVLTAPGER
jgi:hypothetical protein